MYKNIPSIGVKIDTKEVGVASENVYSISDIEAQMAAEDAMNEQTK